jgi:hypothetical protein
MRENHKAEGNGTTAQWDRLTKRTILYQAWNSGRAANSERMSAGGNVSALTETTAKFTIES